MATPIEIPLRDWFGGFERRAARRAPTGLHFVIADRFDAVNVAAWNEVVHGRGVSFEPSFLRAMERAQTPGLSHRTALGFDGERPVLAMSMQLLDVSVDRLRPASTPGLFEPSFERNVKQRALICGNVFSCGLDGAAWNGIDDELASRAVGEVLYRVRRAEKLSGQANLVVMKDLSRAEAERTRALADLSYRLMNGGPSMELALDASWNSHDDYLASMVSKYRSAVKRRIVAPIEAGGCRVVTLSAAEVQRHAARLQTLHRAVQDEASVRPATVGENYWSAMASLDACVVKAIVRGDDVLGFLLLVVDGSTLRAAQIGFDRTAAKELPLYLRLLHTAVEVAIERRCTSVALGRTALEPKARMGAKPVETFMWVRHRVPVVNALAGGLVDLVHHDDAPQIDPFKKSEVELPAE